MCIDKIIINVNIIWFKKAYKKIIFKNGVILLSQDKILVSGEITSTDSQYFSSAYPASVDMFVDMENCIKYSHAKIGEQYINLCTSKSHVLAWNLTNDLNGKIIMSWILSELSYTYESQPIDDFIVLNLPFDKYISKVMKSEYSVEQNFIVKSGSYYKFYKENNVNLLAIKVHSINEYTIDEILVHLSFYLNINVHALMKSIYRNNKVNVSFCSPVFEVKNEIPFHPELIYIDIGSYNGFEYFFQNSSWQLMDESQKEKLRQAIYTFVRCNYCDDTMQFILLYSILDNYVGNSYGRSPYKTMKDRLSHYNIDINKIGKENEPLLQKMQLCLKRDKGNDVNVTNFCLLRNYILHFMSKPIIDEYLKSSELVSKLRFAACIIILYELGFKNLCFQQGWGHLSILK